MTTTPPPMPESQYSFTGNINDINHFTQQQLEDRDAQWMERISSLEADRKMLREALRKLTHYAECQVAAFSSGRPTLDMTLFPHLCADARTILEKTND